MIIIPKIETLDSTIWVLWTLWDVKSDRRDPGHFRIGYIPTPPCCGEISGPIYLQKAVGTTRMIT